MSTISKPMYLYIFVFIIDKSIRVTCDVVLTMDDVSIIATCNKSVYKLMTLEAHFYSFFKTISKQERSHFDYKNLTYVIIISNRVEVQWEILQYFDFFDFCTLVFLNRFILDFYCV